MYKSAGSVCFRCSRVIARLLIMWSIDNCFNDLIIVICGNYFNYKYAAPHDMQTKTDINLCRLLENITPATLVIFEKFVKSMDEGPRMALFGERNKIQEQIAEIKEEITAIRDLYGEPQWSSSREIFALNVMRYLRKLAKHAWFCGRIETVFGEL
jgi:hypothetical protein